MDLLSRISARLDDAASSHQLWREQYDASLEGVFALQDQLAMANVYAAAGRADDVITALERAIESDPSFTLGHVQLGQALAVTGRPDEALAHLHKAIHLSPKDPHAWLSDNGLAMAYFAAERYAEAVEAARRSIQLRPDFAFGYFVLTSCLAQLGRTDDARQALKEDLKRQPGLSCDGLRLALRWVSADYVERVIDAHRKAGLLE